jgi:N-acetylmuramoyl-L-alanine amidase
VTTLKRLRFSIYIIALIASVAASSAVSTIWFPPQVRSFMKSLRPPSPPGLEDGAEEGKLETAISTGPVVVIDAGHGGYDPGSVGLGGTLEKDVTLAVALKLGAILQENNLKVVYTRESDDVTWPADNKLDLGARAAIANNENADLFISIHLNSFTMESVRGTETYYSKNSEKGRDLAQKIQEQIVKSVRLKDRGIREEEYSLLKNVTAPAVLIELGYISNRKEEALLKSISYHDKFAQAIAAGILEYLEP